MVGMNCKNMLGKLYIQGQWLEGEEREFVSIDPATDHIVWKGKSASPNQIQQAVLAAKAAFPAWSSLEFEMRHEYLKKYIEIVQQKKEALVKALSEETGKLYWDAETEIQGVINKLAISVKSYQDRCKDLKSATQTGKNWIIPKPHGVVAIFGPFNFPAHLPNGHLIPALLAGNTCVLKPSELTPRMGELLVLCLEMAQLPVGVVNLIQGGGDTGQTLSKNPGINGVFFTGSFKTGQILKKQFAENPGKILALELGGNNPLIIHEVSDLVAAQYQTLLSAYLTSGQRCSCTRRLIITNGSTAEPFVLGLIEIIKKLNIGRCTDLPEPFVGPLISAKAAEQVAASYQKLISLGGKPLVALERNEKSKALVSPALVDMTNIKSKPDEEIFGPVLQLIRVDTFDEAIQEANNTCYGLTAGLLCNNQKMFAKFSNEIRAGVISWNRPTTNSSSALPFGGIGHSGNFRPSAYYAADYCSYPMSVMEEENLKLPEKLLPGIKL